MPGAGERKAEGRFALCLRLHKKAALFREKGPPLAFLPACSFDLIFKGGTSMSRKLVSLLLCLALCLCALPVLA